jgi:transposase-like protein
MPAKKPRNPVLSEVPLACADETAAVEFMEAQRWGDSPACPSCGDMDVYKMMKRGGEERQENFRWRCRGCGKQYTVRTGTVMEDSAIPLRAWCFAFWQACASKKGVSAKQIERETGISYKSALFLMHRIRFAMAGGDGSPLRGTVEADETYVGGKPRKLSKQAKEKLLAEGKELPRNKRGRGADKQPVLAVVERSEGEKKGRVRTRVVADVTAENLKEMIRQSAHRASTVVTDGLSLYRGIGAEFQGGHRVVEHGEGEYSRKDEYGFPVHSNTVEGFFALLKRAVYGVFHNVSRKHLHRYCSERAFVYNTRGMDDGERLVQAIRQADGLRLTYAAYVA